MLEINRRTFSPIITIFSLSIRLGVFSWTSIRKMVMKVMMMKTISLLDVRLATGSFLRYLMMMATLLLRAVLTKTRIVDTKK